jgi:hypothetical protein
MTFLRKSGNNGKIFAFSKKRDKYWVKKEHILEKLQLPTIHQGS